MIVYAQMKHNHAMLWNVVDLPSLLIDTMLLYTHNVYWRLHSNHEKNRVIYKSRGFHKAFNKGPIHFQQQLYPLNPPKFVHGSNLTNRKY